MDTVAIKTELVTAARQTAEQFIRQHFGGQDAGACGFAWVTIYPKHKGNTRLGRAEREQIRALGFELDWTGRSFQMWNPSGLSCQNIDTKEAGARAAAEVLRKHGFDAYAGSRLD